MLQTSRYLIGYMGTLLIYSYINSFLLPGTLYLQDELTKVYLVDDFVDRYYDMIFHHMYIIKKDQAF